MKHLHLSIYLPTLTLLIPLNTWAAYTFTPLSLLQGYLTLLAGLLNGLATAVLFAGILVPPAALAWWVYEKCAEERLVLQSMPDGSDGAETPIAVGLGGNEAGTAAEAGGEAGGVGTGAAVGHGHGQGAGPGARPRLVIRQAGAHGTGPNMHVPHLGGGGGAQAQMQMQMQIQAAGGGGAELRYLR